MNCQRYIDDKSKLHLVTCLSVDFDLDYVEHFCRHYKKYLIHKWYFILQSNTKNLAAVEKAKRIIGFYNPNTKFDNLFEEYNSRLRIEKLNDYFDSLGNYDWIILADIDEFHQYEMEPKEYAKRGKPTFATLIDRFAENMEPKSVNSKKNIFEQFPIKKHFTKENLEAIDYKPCIFPSNLRLSNSHFFTKDTWSKAVGETLKENLLLETQHFKWTNKTEQKLKRRIDNYKKIGLSWWRESERALDLIYNKHEELETTSSKNITDRKYEAEFTRCLNSKKDMASVERAEETLGCCLKELETDPANRRLYLEVATICDSLGRVDDANFFRQRASEIRSP